MTPATPARPDLDRLQAALSHVLEPTQIVRDPAMAATHAGDWSEATPCAPGMLLFPRSPAQVAAVLKLCAEHRQPLVVQGGLSGLAGGATPREGEVALSLARLNAIEEIDTVGGTALVQAGVVLEELQRRVEAEGWFFPLDLGARGSCQVGGNAATNAGGNRVIRYGTMRELVLGLEVALPDGRVLTMLNRVIKNATGIDLKHLFIGAEGTLGVITRLVLKLAPRPTAACTALCALPSFAAATALMHTLRREVPGLSAFELMWRDFMDAAIQMAALRPPFHEAAPGYALVETLGGDEARDRALLEDVLGRALETGLVHDVVIAQSLQDSQRLWAYREAVGEMLMRLKPFAAFDVGIPLAGMEAFVDEVRQQLIQSFPDRHHLFFGHIGDGNLHVLSGPHAEPGVLHQVEAVVYAATGRAGGSISAEHGIGVVKKDFLNLSRSPGEVEVMRGLKALLDPVGILNSGRIFD